MAAVALALVAAATLPVAAQDAPPAGWEWLQDFLHEFSVVADIDADSGARDVVSTRLETHPDDGRAILSYQRSTYATGSPRSLERRQVIQYTLSLDDVDRKAIESQAWIGPRSGEEYWMVMAPIREDSDFVPYTNLVEIRLDDGSVDVTSSRGRVRTVALGYFTSQAAASEFAKGFRAFLSEPGTSREA